ncbi:MAG: EmrB/QacA family drug resistance transporter, partial [Legionella sp. 21-45-4]
DLAYPTLNAGLVMAPVGIFAVICSPIIGQIMPKIDSRRMVTLAFILFFVVFFWRSLYTSNVDVLHLVMPTLLQGFPMAMFFIPLSVIILSGLPPEKIPSAAGLSNFVRVFCGAVGTSIATTEWDYRSIFHHAQLTEQATPYTSVFIDFTHTTQQAFAFTFQQSSALFNQMVGFEADMLGLNDIFRVSALIFLFLIPFVWITRPLPAKSFRGSKSI